MSKKPLKPGQLKRVGGLGMFCMGVGMLLTLIIPGISLLFALVLIFGGFYFLFM